MSTTTPVPGCITVSFADSSGAAGVYGDLKTFSALDSYGTAVITAIGIPGAAGIDRSRIEPSLVVSQFQGAVRYFEPSTVKVGYLGSAKTAEAIALEIEDLASDTSVVIDPSLIDRTGHWISERATADVFREKLIPRATIITPNIAEAELLIGRKLETASDIEDTGKHMLELGPEGVIITGGHRNGAYSDDLLAWNKPDGSGPQVTWLRAARIGIDRIDGGGCTLSSGIAACLAKGLTLPEATEEAKIYLTAALRAGSRWQSEQGTGPLHHFYAWWNRKEQMS